MEFEELGVPAVVIAVPAWYGPAVKLARSFGLSEKRIVKLPLGDVFGDSSEAIPLIKNAAGDVARQIARAFTEPVLAGRVGGGHS